MVSPLRERAIKVLRWSEKYTKTDMVYLVNAGFWSNLNLVITSILGLLLSVAYANLLPADVFGVYQFLLSLSAIVTALALAGMNNAVSQAVSRGYEGVLRTSVGVQLRWSTLPTALGLLGAIYYFAHGNTAVALGLVVVALLSPITNVFNTYVAFLNGKREFRMAFLLGTVITAAYYISIFLAVAYLKNAVILIAVNLGSNALATAYAYWQTLRTYKPNDQQDPAAISYGKHLSVMNAFGTIVTQLDSVLVFHFLGAAELAIYTFATSIPERVGGMSKFLSVAALPKFANQSPETIRANLLSKMLRAGIAGAILAAIYALFAPIIFDLLFPNYLAAIPFTQVYALMIVTVAVSNISVTALVSQRLNRELYIYNFVNPIVLLGLQVPFLIYYGIMGILAAKILSSAFNIVLSSALLHRAAERTQ